MPKDTRTGAKGPKNTVARAPKPKPTESPVVSVGKATASLASSAAEYDMRLTRFLGELGSLSEEQWVLVAERFAAQKRTLDMARRGVDDIFADVSSGKIKPFARTQAKWRTGVK